MTSFKFKLYVEYSYFNLVIAMGIILCGGIPTIIPLAFINLLSRYITSRNVLQTLSSKI